MKELKQTLLDELEAEFETLEGMNLGSEEYKIAVDGVTKLMDKAIELEKIRIDEETKTKDQELKQSEIEIREDENSIKRKEITIKQSEIDQKNKCDKSNQIFKIVELAITVVGIVVPAWVTIYGTKKCLKFEETGTVTTTPGREHTKNLFKLKWK